MSARLTGDGLLVLSGALSEVATTIPCTGLAAWTLDSGDYPLLISIGGELIEVTGAETSPSEQFTGATRSVNGISKSHAADTVVEVAQPFRLGLGSARAAPATVVPGGGGGGGGVSPEIPAFGPTFTTITPAQNAKTIIEAGSPGDHFLLTAGTHTGVSNVLVKSSMHIRLAEGCILDADQGGSFTTYCFRPATSTTDDVVIGGDPNGARPIIRNFGKDDINCAPIMGITDDRANGQYIYTDVNGWFIYHLDFEENGDWGIKLGSNFTVFDCEFHGHLHNGIQGDRIVGPWIIDNLFYWNALDPATGSNSDGAHIKLTWNNGDIGRTDITPVDRDPVQGIVEYNTFEAYDRGAGTGRTRIHMWCDLDCHDIIVRYNEIYDAEYHGIILEGCNSCDVHDNDLFDCEGYGPAWNDDFTASPITIAESTNCRAFNNTLTNCNWGIRNRLSNRSADWLSATDPNNYAYPASGHYWILNTTAIPLPYEQSNVWDGNNEIFGNTFVSCPRGIILDEGTDDATQTTHGASLIEPTDCTGNDYSGSPGIVFHNKSTTSLSLAQWQAAGGN